LRQNVAVATHLEARDIDGCPLRLAPRTNVKAAATLKAPTLSLLLSIG
jgi:hypothetical protein